MTMATMPDLPGLLEERLHRPISVDEVDQLITPLCLGDQLNGLSDDEVLQLWEDIFQGAKGQPLNDKDDDLGDTIAEIANSLLDERWSHQTHKTMEKTLGKSITRVNGILIAYTDIEELINLLD